MQTWSKKKMRKKRKIEMAKAVRESERKRDRE